MNQGSLSNKKTGFLVNYIANSRERRLIVFSLIVSLCLVLAGFLSIYVYRHILFTEDFRHYKGTFKEIGSISRIGFFGAISIYPIFFLLRYKKIKELKWRSFQVKPLLQFIAKIVRKWHAPIALLSTGIVTIHVYMAVLRGFKLDFTYISGIVAAGILPVLLYMGLMRYKRKDRNLHFKLAIAFLILFMIHASFS